MDLRVGEIGRTPKVLEQEEPEADEPALKGFRVTAKTRAVAYRHCWSNRLSID